MKKRSGLFLVLIGSLTSAAWCQDAILRGTIKDAATGSTSACTIAITDSKGTLVTENDSFRAGFRCSGQFTRRLPAGPTRIRVTRGFETQGLETELQLEAGMETNITFVLHRNVDLRKRGWVAGDSHVHMLHGERTVPVTFDFVALTARAEDLQYLSLAQAWNLEDPTPEALEAQLRPRSTPGCLLTWNLEAPKNYYKGDAGRCLGHCWNLGVRGRTSEGANVIQTLLDASAWDYEADKPTYLNFESHRLIHAQGGAVFYTHPARWWRGSWGGKAGYPKFDNMRVSNMAVELPLDTVLGPTFDGLDVMTGPGEFEANQKAFRIWTLLLNHGYRLAATGSSDACFDRPGGAIPGVPRTYTFIPARFSLRSVTRATIAGHTFVTTGPLLLAALDGKPPGTSFRCGNNQHVLAIEGWASGDSFGGLDHLELLRNGQTAQVISFANQPDSFRTNLVLQESRPAWYCLRLWASGAKPRMASTSAFYFDDEQYRPPQPLSIRVQARLIDAEDGRPLSGSLSEMAYLGTLSRAGKRHEFAGGQAELTIPGTVRLCARAKGYAPLVLSPVLENQKLMASITQLTDADLLDWKTFEKIQTEAGTVELEFKLHKVGPQPHLFRY